MSRLHSVAILAMSVVALAMSLGATLLGADRNGLYADPGRPEAAASMTVTPGP
jgi:hypothetical protein